MTYWDEDKKREWQRKMRGMPEAQRQGWQREIDFRDMEEEFGVVAENLRQLPPERAESVMARVRKEGEYLARLREEKDRLGDLHGDEPDRETEYEKQEEFVRQSQHLILERCKEEYEREKDNPGRSARDVFSQLKRKHEQDKDFER